MLRFVVTRALRALVTLVAISGVTFVLFFIVPANPAQVNCGKNCDPQQIHQTLVNLGLDQPKLAQYTAFVRGIVVGRDYGSGEFARHCAAPCLGYSYRSNEPVTQIVARTLPVTLSIVIPAAVLWIIFGVALGVISALRKGTLFDRLSIGVAVTGASLQVYFFGLLLLMIAVYGLKIIPYPQYVSLWVDPVGWVKAMILPWLTLGFLNAALYARLSRAQMLETLSEDFVRTARAKGVTRRTVHLRHALRAAINPVVTVAGLDIGLNLGGTVITERVFSLNGLGKAAVDAVTVLNLPVVLATVLLAAAFIVVANVIVDGLYAAVDPRVRLGT